MLRAALIALVALLLAPAMAGAHGGATGGTDYRSDILSVPDGVEAWISGGDDRLVLTRTGADEVIVLGYGGEPYLRLDADGVWQNMKSPAVALNEERLPEEALEGSDGEPDWVRTDTGRSAVFHDHRAHWMGSTAPAEVRADPNRVQTLFDWSVPLVVNGEETEITGDVTWLGRPATWLWWIVAAGAGLAGLIAGLLSIGRHVLLAAIGAAAAIGAGTAIGVSQQLDVPDGESGALLALGITAVIAAAAGVGAYLVRRTAAHAASVLLVAAIIAGGLQLGTVADASFSYTLVPGPIPSTLTRVLIVVGLAGVGLAAGACARAWRDLLADTDEVGRADAAT